MSSLPPQIPQPQQQQTSQSMNPELRRLQQQQQYALLEQQLNQHALQQLQEAQLKHSPNSWRSTLREKSTQMAMGYCMGQFVGSSVVALHYLTSRQSLRNGGIKTIVGGGMAFGTIFAVGSLIR
jgi:hypothetical protein